MRVFLVFCLLCLTGPSCEEDEAPGSPPKVKDTHEDASIPRRTPTHDGGRVAELPSQNGKLAELAGQWEGEVTGREIGSVHAKFVVDEIGHVHSSLSGPSLRREDRLRILHWDGRQLKLLLPDAQEQTVAARLSQGQMILELPQVGSVTLSRVPAPEPLK